MDCTPDALFWRVLEGIRQGRMKKFVGDIRPEFHPDRSKRTFGRHRRITFERKPNAAVPARIVAVGNPSRNDIAENV